MSLGRGFLTVGGMTLLSRFLGLAREILIAATLGAGGAADAFYAAFRLPNLFRRVFAEGAFSMAFVPLFTKKLEDGSAQARHFGSEALAGLASLLFVLSLVATLAMPALIYALAGGFADVPGKLDFTVLLARIMFPYLLLISLTALFSAVLNALGKFAVAAGAPILLNLFMCGAILAAVGTGGDVALFLAFGVALAGGAQLWLVAAAAARAGIKLRVVRPRLTPDMRRLLALAAPAALAGGALQINLVIGSLIASFFEGAVSWLNYADRLYQLPLGVVGIAVGVVLMPTLARLVKREDAAGARGALNRACEFTLALTLPAAVALIVIPEPITRVLFERGAFGASDTEATAIATALFALGLPAYVLNKAMTPAFFAAEDTRTPLRLSLWAMAINIVLSVIGAATLGWLAIPVATAIAAWINVAMLWRILRTRGYASDGRLRARVPRLMLASVVMGAALFALGWWLSEPLEGAWRLLALLAVVGAGGAVYATAARLAGAFTLSELKAGLRRAQPDTV